MADRSNTKRINVAMTLHEALFSHRIRVACERWVGDFRNCFATYFDRFASRKPVPEPQNPLPDPPVLRVCAAMFYRRTYATQQRCVCNTISYNSSITEV